MLGARRRKFVSPNAAVSGRDVPLGLCEFFFQEALKRRIKRSFFNLQQVVACSFDVLYKSLAMQRLSFERPENHHLQRTWKQVSLFAELHRNSTSPWVGSVGSVILGLD